MNEPTKYYISGAISTLPLQEARALFARAEERLRQRGHEVLNPTLNGLPPGASWAQHMALDIMMLLSCRAVYMLPNWELSRGATLEHGLAKEMGMLVEYEREPRHQALKDAIRRVMGVGFHDLAADNRSRWHVYARVIYTHHARGAGDSIAQITADILHGHATVGYYLRKYHDEMKYNPEFRAAASNVEALLGLDNLRNL